ncbi:RED-like protein N-terminal region-domain-containing protein [Gamsiella multidivaricata]|uniref:RED-like protein N-terminal region-domain-containing protein n=1 Tax=Gamsiella multidivaricata TaxID=101098 RepID=UPI00221E5AD4|nr:RED-like protein N-terminal region-domain-containing protein [Gamsiella multidivaricata]KAI7820008.1 RED-like protein N-terminal region-domain-containing protein [Gamsiella multidivaricata]
MSNSMPPPAFKPSAEKKEEKAGGLSQDDFRKLLATPRAAPGGTGGIGGSFSGGSMRALGMAGRTARVPAPQTPRSSEGGSNKHKYKKHAQKTPAKDASAAGSKYRDRATERRQGMNPDYIETEQILSTLEEAAAEVAPEVMYEQSKFLGGDREHTHLVKGLDYALLNKVRQEDSGQDSEVADLDKVFETVEKAVKAEGSTVMKQEEEVPETNSVLARDVFKYAIEEPAKRPPKVNEMFLPGRTVFVFELPITTKSKKPKAGFVEDNNPFAVPTTVVRSRADVDQHLAGTVENPEADMVMKKVMDVLQAIRTGERKIGESEAELKAKRKAAAAAAAKIAAAKLQDEETLPMVEPDLEGEDIFADAGREYVVEPEHKDESAPDHTMDVDGDDQGPIVGPARPDDVDMSRYFSDDSDNDENQYNEDMTDGSQMDVQGGELDSEAPVLGPARPTDVDLNDYFGEESANEDSDGNDGSAQEDAEEDTHYSDPNIAGPSANGPSSAAAQYTTPFNEKALSRKKPRLESLEVDEDADYYSAYGLGVGGGLGTTAYDSDEDDDQSQSTILIDQGTHKNKRAQLGRFDFDTEEGFNRYKDTVEVVPKTSFQYGVKMSDGRKTGKWDDGKGKGLSKDEKLDRDWQRISRLMEKNSGSGNAGHKNKPKRDEEPSSGGGSDSRNKRRKNNW